MGSLEERCREPGENDAGGHWGGGGGGAVNLEREGGWFFGKGRVSGTGGLGERGGRDEPVSKDQ